MPKASRRAPGDGSVYYEADRGCWVGAVELGRDPRTGRRVRRKVSAPTRTQARAALAALLEEKRRTGTVGRRDITVEAIVRELLASPPADWRSPVTVQVNTGHAERIIAALGRRTLAALTVSDVERLLYGMAEDGYARATIGGTRTLLRRALRRAERDGLVGRNVAGLAEMPAASRRKSRAMTLVQVRQLLGSDLTPWWRALIITGVMSGLRPGELLGLLWDDVDFAAGVIRVRQSMKDSGALAALKTEQSRRTLAMPAAVVGALRALRADQAAARLRAGRAWADSGLVFCGEAGQPRQLRGVRAAFGRVTARAGIGHWQPREMRHTFVSVLSDAGIDIEQIADAAGHVSSNVTRTVYRHQIADVTARAAQAMDRIFGTGSAS
jgi:integrase